MVSIDKAYSDLEQGKDYTENDEDLIKSLQKERKCLTVLNSVIGITWGDWVGSPDNQQARTLYFI